MTSNVTAPAQLVVSNFLYVQKINLFRLTWARTYHIILFRLSWARTYHKGISEHSQQIWHKMFWWHHIQIRNARYMRTRPIWTKCPWPHVVRIQQKLLLCILRLIWHWSVAGRRHHGSMTSSQVPASAEVYLTRDAFWKEKHIITFRSWIWFQDVSDYANQRRGRLRQGNTLPEHQEFPRTQEIDMSSFSFPAGFGVGKVGGGAAWILGSACFEINCMIRRSPSLSHFASLLMLRGPLGRLPLG